MDLKIVENAGFHPTATITKPMMDEEVLAWSMKYFDKDGFEINELEQAYYRNNDIFIDGMHLFHIANQTDWILDIEQSEEHIIVTLDLPENNFNLVGSEFRIGFDNTRLEYDKLETTTTMNTFDAKRETYLKIGSISVDGSQNLNSGVQYKIYFKSTQTFDSTLGLVSVKKSEVVDSNAKQIGVIIK